jgi:hypothetical protein
MFKVYCITDVHGIQYVGQTKKSMSSRLAQHRYDKKLNNGCSSKLLNLDDCMLNVLEECYTKEEVLEAEKKWIKKIKCVNIIKYKGRCLENKKTDKYKKSQCDYMRYKRSWGGDKCYNNNNNLLCISMDVFN